MVFFPPNFPFFFHVNKFKERSSYHVRSSLMSTFEKNELYLLIYKSLPGLKKLHYWSDEIAFSYFCRDELLHRRFLD